MRSTPILFILFAACSSGNDEGAPSPTVAPTASVHGIVSDTSGRPIANASVYLVDTDFQTVTDSMGRYELVSLPGGTLQLGVAFIFHIARVEEITVTPGQVVERNVALIPTQTPSFPDLLVEAAEESAP